MVAASVLFNVSASLAIYRMTNQRVHQVFRNLVRGSGQPRVESRPNRWSPVGGIQHAHLLGAHIGDVVRSDEMFVVRETGAGGELLLVEHADMHLTWIHHPGFGAANTNRRTSWYNMEVPVKPAPTMAKRNVIRIFCQQVDKISCAWQIDRWHGFENNRGRIFPGGPKTVGARQQQR